MNFKIHPLPSQIDMILPTSTQLFVINQHKIYFYERSDAAYNFKHAIDLPGIQIAHSDHSRLIVSGISGTQIFDCFEQIYTNSTPSDSVFTEKSLSAFTQIPNLITFSISTSTKILPLQIPVKQVLLNPFFALHGPFLRQGSASFSSFYTRQFAVSKDFVALLGLNLRISDKIGEFGTGKFAEFEFQKEIQFVSFEVENQFIIGIEGGMIMRIKVEEVGKVVAEELFSVAGEISGLMIEAGEVFVVFGENEVWVQKL